MSTVRGAASGEASRASGSGLPPRVGPRAGGSGLPPRAGLPGAPTHGAASVGPRPRPTPGCAAGRKPLTSGSSRWSFEGLTYIFESRIVASIGGRRRPDGDAAAAPVRIAGGPSAASPAAPRSEQGIESPDLDSQDSHLPASGVSARPSTRHVRWERLGLGGNTDPARVRRGHHEPSRGQGPGGARRAEPVVGVPRAHAATAPVVD